MHTLPLTVKRRGIFISSHKSCLLLFCCLALMLSIIGRQRFAAAFVTKPSFRYNGRNNYASLLSNSVVRLRNRQERFPPLLQMVKKATKATYKRQQSLVVFGPEGFVPNKKWDRPFKLVIVESPSKCNTISKILQEYVETEGLDYDFVVTSCMGHIRNIPQTKTEKGQKIAGIDLEGGKYTPTYAILPEKEALVSDLQKLSAQAQQLVLATDDDREGEAMAWHLLQVLREESQEISLSDQLPPLRVRFTEITPKAITNGIANAAPKLRENLVQAQETRRILDRLAGFTVSPILWKKIAPGLSAGRVQSVGMALIVRRERERLLFQETQYWDIQANFTAKADTFASTLVSVNGSPIASGGKDFESQESDKLVESSSHKVHLKEEDARNLVRRFETENWKWTIANITESQRSLNPPAPFITSTLQQEANNRLGFSVSQTMRTAQQLYEKGYISYMRTDSNHLSDDAKDAIRLEIKRDYGGEENFQLEATYRASKKKKQKTPEAQAAHEAIRPAIQPNSEFTKPNKLPPSFDKGATELYRLIYQRTVASHMPPQVSMQTTVRILGEAEVDDSTTQFRTSGSVVVKPGYTLVYPRENREDSPILPALKNGQNLSCEGTEPIEHITLPPPRYNEASFVKELEAMGVGRPSTFAGTVKILRDRAYVGSPVTGKSGGRRTKEVSGTAISAQRAAGGEEFTGTARGPMVPSLSAFVVCSLFEKYCDMYVDPSFTASMEERLDMIANAEEMIGEDERVAYLDEFYAGDKGLAAQIQLIDEVVDGDDARRADLPSLKQQQNASDDKEIGLFVGPWGPYIRKVSHDASNEDEKPITAQLPAGMASDLSTITLSSLANLLTIKEQNGLVLGPHPDDGRSIRLKLGRYGAFLQHGEDDEEGTTTHTLPAHLRQIKNIDAISGEDIAGLTFEEAVQYTNLPRTVCEMDGKPILAAFGPYGPYLKFNNTYVSLKKSDGDVLSITPEIAKLVVTEGLTKKSKLGAGVLEEIGEKEGSRVTVKNGRFGPYVNWKKVNAKLPEAYLEDPSTLPLEEAWELIEAKAGDMGSKANSKKQTKKDKSDLPAGPKRPLSAYLHFCAEKREEVSKAHSSLGETSKELARLWSETSDSDRKVYQELANQSKEEYKEKKAKWEEECNGLMKKSGGTSARKKSKCDVKRPRSSYVWFCSEKRADVAKKFDRLGDVSKELGRMWKEVSIEERKVYEEMASRDKERYEREKVMSGKLPTSASASLKKASKPQSKTKAKKRSPSGYMLFCAANRNSIVDHNGEKLPLGETTKRLATMWKNCDDETKNEFLAQAEREKVTA